MLALLQRAYCVSATVPVLCTHPRELALHWEKCSKADSSPACPPQGHVVSRREAAGWRTVVKVKSSY